MTTPKQTLIAARALIADERRWTKRAKARDEYGLIATPTDERAICFCSIGAIEKVCCRYVEQINARQQLNSVISMSLSIYNDTHTHAEVLAMFDKAIEAAE